MKGNLFAEKYARALFKMIEEKRTVSRDGAEQLGGCRNRGFQFRFESVLKILSWLSRRAISSKKNSRFISEKPATATSNLLTC